MFSLDHRFTLLVLFCGFSTQWLAPISSAAAMAVARPPPSRRSSFSGSFTHAQIPWSPSHAKIGATHHKRMNDLSPSNPFSKFAGAVLSGLRRKGHHKRSVPKSILIPADHGKVFTVPHSRRAPDTPLWRVSQTGSSAQRRDSGGVAGTVGVMSNIYNGTLDDSRLIASLFLTDMNGTYVLNASDTNKTQLYLVKAPSSTTTRDPATANSDENMLVNLAIPSFANGLPFCATFDPNPPGAEPMTMEKCFDANVSDADTPHSSQTFIYNKTSGVIRPTWFLGQDDGMTNTTTAQDISSASGDSSTASATSSTLSANATDTTTSAQPTSTATLTTRDDQHNTQNVTLVFIPAGNAAAADASDRDSAQSQSVSSSIATTSGTTSQTLAASSIISGSLTDASIAPPSTSNTGPMSSQSATGLNVELVGDGSLPQSSTTSSAPISAFTSLASGSALSMSSASYLAAAAAPSASPLPSSSSINAAAVAASIASSASAASASASMTSSSYPAANTDPQFPVTVVSSSASSASSASDTPSTATFVAAVMQRNAPTMTPVSTSPYKWRFRTESR